MLFDYVMRIVKRTLSIYCKEYVLNVCDAYVTYRLHLLLPCFDISKWCEGHVKL